MFLLMLDDDDEGRLRDLIRLFSRFYVYAAFLSLVRFFFLPFLVASLASFSFYSGMCDCITPLFLSVVGNSSRFSPSSSSSRFLFCCFFSLLRQLGNERDSAAHALSRAATATRTEQNRTRQLILHSI